MMIRPYLVNDRAAAARFSAAPRNPTTENPSKLGSGDGESWYRVKHAFPK
jgi:hypothetical protein